MDGDGYRNPGSGRRWRLRTIYLTCICLCLLFCPKYISVHKTCLRAPVKTAQRAPDQPPVHAQAPSEQLPWSPQCIPKHGSAKIIMHHRLRGGSTHQHSVCLNACTLPVKFVWCQGCWVRVTEILAAVAGVGRGLASAGTAGASSVVAAVDAGAWVCDRAVRGNVRGTVRGTDVLFVVSWSFPSLCLSVCPSARPPPVYASARLLVDLVVLVWHSLRRQCVHILCIHESFAHRVRRCSACRCGRRCSCSSSGGGGLSRSHGRRSAHRISRRCNCRPQPSRPGPGRMPRGRRTRRPRRRGGRPTGCRRRSCGSTCGRCSCRPCPTAARRRPRCR